MRRAVTIVLLTVLAVRDVGASGAVQTRPCAAGFALVCDSAGCSCRASRARDGTWLVLTPAPPSGTLSGGPGRTGYTCVPELHQCGCNGFIDCVDMLLDLKVRCEFFGCNDLGCVCHFPNSIPK